MANESLEIIREYVKAHPQSSFTEIFEGTGQVAVYATVRRDLARYIVSNGTCPFLLRTCNNNGRKFVILPNIGNFAEKEDAL